jgi:hypothetical protein
MLSFFYAKIYIIGVFLICFNFFMNTKNIANESNISDGTSAQQGDKNNLNTLKQYRHSTWQNIKSENALKLFLYTLSVPFIYGMIIPAIFMHICIEIYHQICFRLYRIPLVSSREYFAFDRMYLPQLNLFEKVNCLYCSYFNCLVAYVQEIAGRTERFWCPIKHAKKMKAVHNQYSHFFEYSDGKSLRENWEQLQQFEEFQKKTSQGSADEEVCFRGKLK